MSDQTTHRHTNRLIHSTSPYLLQHAHNPVDWYPWGDEALNRAKEEGKPIFLSIGYSACHWCHVMERESFENEAIAGLMNQSFINIKIDREERPDLDEIYMSAVQAMTGSGGWPMSVFLTPDLKPFYGGTYFPPQDMYGRPGFGTLLQSISHTWKDQQQQAIEAAENLTSHIQKMVTVPTSDGELTLEMLEAAYTELSRRFDPRHGGFGTEPKFPHSMDLGLLLRHYHAHPEEKETLEMVEMSLKKMARGGIYDQIGGGFHRYSVDTRWLVPHFEKMLYDNALLVRLYTEAWQITKDPFCKTIVKETLAYIKREMTAPEGYFYSTQDADSEGVEGKFFVWTPEEIRTILEDEKLAQVAIRYYNVEPHGNFEDGKSILHVDTSDEDIAKLEDITVEELHQMIAKIKCKLFGARDKRVKPGLDDKILTDWNGLMISSMAFAGNVFQQEEYVQSAEVASKALLELMVEQDRLLHTAKDGVAHTHGFLSDYAFLVHGLIDVYEATGNPRWLKESLYWNEQTLKLFWDDENGAFFYTEKDQSHMIARSKNPMDNAIPSGNSIAIFNLLRLSEMTANTDLREKAEISLRHFKHGMEEIPMGYGQMLQALDFMLRSPKEIVLSGESMDDLQEMKQALYGEFIPNKVVLYATDHDRSDLSEVSSVIENKTTLNGMPTAYVCENFTCQQPVKTVADMLNNIK